MSSLLCWSTSGDEPKRAVAQKAFLQNLGKHRRLAQDSVYCPEISETVANPSDLDLHCPSIHGYMCHTAGDSRSTPTGSSNAGPLKPTHTGRRSPSQYLSGAIGVHGSRGRRQGLDCETHMTTELHTLSWHIQQQTHGGLDAGTRRLLKAAIRNAPTPASKQSDATHRKQRDPVQLAEGTTLVRTWRGHHHEVTVLEDGKRFRYRDTEFASLSEIAREITGARWSGPRFFGLKKLKQASIRSTG